MPSASHNLLALADTPLFMYPAAALALAEVIRARGLLAAGENVAVRADVKLGVSADLLPFVGRLMAAVRPGDDAAPRADWTSDTTDGPRKRYEIDNGIVTIPVHGSLANKRAEAWYGETSYEDFRETLGAALEDPECKAILLDVDSPGGAAAGAMETSAFIRAAAARKPIVAFVDGMACSAAYALACGALDIVAAPSATTGSIGVVMLHWDMSQMLDNIGLKPTLLHSGAYKTDGWPTKPLDPDAQGRLQRTLDVHYQHFTTTVGANRPMIGEKGARRTEAGVFVGSEAVSRGLVDALGDLAAARAVALARVSAAATPAGGGPRLAGRSGAVFLRLRSEKMSVHLYGPGRSHADHLIDDGKVDKESAWSFSAEDGDKLLGDDGDDWDNYASFHLGEDDSETEKTKARFKYPFGKDGKVYRSGLIAAKRRAAQQEADDIEKAASKLVEKIDGKSEEEARMADQEALAAARREGVTAERTRIGAILNSEPAKTRTGAALVFALKSDMTAETAVEALAATPAAVAAPPAPTRLEDRVPRLNLGQDGPTPADMGETDRGAAAFARALGKKV